MKTPSGSRNDLASNSDREDAGTHEGDDPEMRAMRQGSDDPEMRAMRQVWIAMREETPPDGGMAALLGAARAKADAMRAAPTLWQRVLRGLRRPQALAFAAVIVLVGGAAIVGRRLDRARDSGGAPGESEASAEVPRGSAVSSGAAATRPEDVVRPGIAGDDAARTIAETSDPAGNTPPSAALETTAVLPAQAGAGGTAPAGPARPGWVSPTGARDTGETRDAVRDPETGHGAARSEPDAAVRTATLGGGRVAPPALPHGSPAAPPAPVPASPRERTRASRKRDDGSSQSNQPPSDRDASRTSDRAERSETNAPAELPGAPMPSLSSLYRQCEAAAERGDCVAVGRLLGQITARDPDYRARIARDSAVARCLASNAD